MGHTGSWSTVGSLKYDERGQPYYDTSDGQRYYEAPATAAQEHDPRAAAWAGSQGAALTRDAAGNTTGLQDSSVTPGGLLRGPSEWDNERGVMRRPIAWGNITGLAIGGAIAAPFIAPTAAHILGLGAAGGGSSVAGAPALGSAATGVVAGGGVPAATGGGMAGLGLGWGDVFKMGTNLFGSLYGAHAQTSAANQAADATSRAAMYGANLQDQAAQRTDAYLRQQAENAYANSEATRRANYDLFSARARALNSIRQGLGYGTVDVPAYVPTVDPKFVGAGQTPAAMTAAAALGLAPGRQLQTSYAPGTAGSYLS